VMGLNEGNNLPRKFAHPPPAPACSVQARSSTSRALASTLRALSLAFEAQDERDEIVGIARRELDVRHVGVAAVEERAEGERGGGRESGHFRKCCDAAPAGLVDRAHPMAGAAPMLGEVAAIADISADILSGRNGRRRRQPKGG